MTLLAFFASIFKIWAALLWGQGVDYGVAGEIRPMLLSALGMVLLVLLDGGRTVFHYTVVGRVTEGMLKKMRLDLFHATAQADPAHISSGDITTRLTADTDRLLEIFANNFSHYSRIIAQALVAIVACVLLSWQLALGYFILLPVSLWVLKAVSQPLTRLGKEAMDHTGQYANIMADTVAGITAVKMFAMEDARDKDFAHHLAQNFHNTRHKGKIAMWLSNIKYMVAVLQTMVLFALGAWLVQQSIITIGTVMAFVALAVYVSETFGVIDRIIATTKSAFAISQRLLEVLQLPKRPGEIPLPATEYVNLQDFHFAYTPDSDPVLKGVTIAVNQGQKVALVGDSGSGKSTLLKVVGQMYGSQLAMVSQAPYLFEGTVLDNLRLGNPSATEAQAQQALDMAKLPLALDMPLGEFGHGLSGGQRQRLSIARAFIKDAPLILLDEPTSALDPQTEAGIIKALDILLQGKAALIVAHRLSTIVDVDYVYCLGAGQVIEAGTPGQLYRSQGYFYHMCKLQNVEVPV